MNTYRIAGIEANVGYEIGTPAYPDPVHDRESQLPLTKAMLSSIISRTQPRHPSGFFWELYKPADYPTNADATETAQAICNRLMPGNPRCVGTIPEIPIEALRATGNGNNTAARRH